ncbi:ribonucleoside-diphosphate reductase subunit alpha [Stutzerimonas kirkiae]|uniref:Ribonucleoside-diphosphate reductase n=1 Tax=Stutzerimonas kirkiae TaxID=2211392 RepID=A0A4Q9R1H7_9GAMM|nr:ribonucleoside-diphosphate reductase subunit alpha [Stutzerimonas kirkiae]TBU92813.1 ribonucleoside-diphosphate reductase subunit alpha [Stutzerimonas kirkiae]TBV01276.1 ribonucleoside-diphosphate reductase subunit alpha [Stutzerimonas kirkiae]TBV14527.1 ribonucleoside-diphosphate reductase subunit alpha [Stutzerimonas kirkiae]
MYSDPSRENPLATGGALDDVAATAPGLLRVIKRNGTVVAYTDDKITVAITKAFLAVEGNNAAASSRIHDTVQRLTEQVTTTFKRRMPSGGTIHIEEIQDQVELALMRAGEQKVARDYVLYREARTQERKRATENTQNSVAQPHPSIRIARADGSVTPLDMARLATIIADACEGLAEVDGAQIERETLKNLYDGVAEKDVNTALVMTARTLVEREPNYSYVTARLLMDTLRAEALSFLNVAGSATHHEMADLYGKALAAYVEAGVEFELLDPKLKGYDLARLGAAIDHERDQQFTYLGLQTLYDRYFIHKDGIRFELPQIFFMRVAMGLAIEEEQKEVRAIEFYNLLSSFDYMASTPTLFNAGTLRPQLSSCYLTTVPDDLGGIYDAIRDNALLSKFAGGLGNDWTPVRALGAYIKGTNGKSQGVVPFLKVVNDTAVAVNQGGKRKGAVCAYLETWHLDIEEFLELRKNTGDDRRRTHDMNTANWVPDLFMKRVFDDGPWTLFSPSDVPDLHDLTGKAFEERYEYYEELTKYGKLKLFKTIAAKDLWRKMLSMLFETGHPWITFKDPCNLRSPQQHVGVVHSSNLCTEITLNTNKDEIAVCNLGSINLPNHIRDGKLDTAKLERTVRTAVRMLDNVIDINYYSVPQARNSNIKHRPVGLGIMGFQDALYLQHIAYGSEAAIEFADHSMEAVSYYAIQASCDLADERGAYQTFEGSLWSQGILPLDSQQILIESRGQKYIDVDLNATLDWAPVRERVKKGIRNSNIMAIAPTATIANITGVSQSIEPTYQNLYVKSNLSGEFTVINPYLVRDLKARDLWDPVMVNDLKYYDGSVQQIERIPQDLKDIYATAFEVETKWIVDAASRRQKWIDQAQSLNLYIAGASGKKLDVTYRMAWYRGLKTTYYLRALAATSTEKSTINTGKLNAVSSGGDNVQAAPAAAPQPAPVPLACSIDNPDCEACQ